MTAALVPDVLPADVDGWVDQVRGHLSRSVESIVAAGQTLLAAKASLAHGELGEVITRAGLSPDAAQALMAIARSELVAKTAPARLLPASVSTLHELTKLPVDVAEPLIVEGLIGPDTTREQVRRFVRDHKAKTSSAGGPAGAAEEGTGSGSAPDPVPNPALERLAALAASRDVHRQVAAAAGRALDTVDHDNPEACAAALAEVRDVQYVTRHLGAPGTLGRMAAQALKELDGGTMTPARAAQLLRPHAEEESPTREGGGGDGGPGRSSSKPDGPPSVAGADPAEADPSAGSAGYEGAQGLQPHHHTPRAKTGPDTYDLARTVVGSARQLLEAFDQAKGAQCLETWCGVQSAEDVARLHDELRRLHQHLADAVLFTQPIEVPA